MSRKIRHDSILATPLLQREIFSNVDNLLPWEYSSKKDLSRRFLLSMTKSLDICIFIILNLETFSVIRTRELNEMPYPMAMLLAISGGLVEPVLSCFPTCNREWLSVWNGVYQTLENILLKLFTNSIFFCGYVEVGEVKHRYLPEAGCIQQKKSSILALVGCLSILSLLSGYMEYSKYAKLKILSGPEKSCIERNCKYLDHTHVFYRVVDSSVDVGLSTISFLSMFSTILKLRTGSELPLLGELIPTAAFMLIAGIVEYRKDSTIETRKKVYFASEFARPSLGNYYASIYLIFTAIPFVFKLDVAVMSKELIYSLLAVAYLVVVGFNLLRAYDSTWYKFTMHQPHQGTQDVPIDALTESSSIQNRAAKKNRCCACDCQSWKFWKASAKKRSCSRI